MKRIAMGLAALLVLTALLPLTALADIQRGDRGEGVRELQTLLMETGWLFEEPDGIFGKHTEEALKKFQSFMGLPVNGKADETVLHILRQSWSDLHGQAYNNDPTYKPNPGANGCRVHMTEDGLITFDYCSEHTEMLAKEADLLALATVEGARQACALWEDHIEEVYSLWLDSASAENKLGVMSAYGAWKAATEKQREALEAAYPDDPLFVETQMGRLLKAQALMLCSFGVQYGASE